MILINLLPHRELARQKAQRAFNGSLAASAVVGALLAAGVYGWYQNQIENQQGRNAFLKGKITQLDSQIKEVASLSEEIAALRARQDAVESLQTDRNLPVHLMNESVAELPDGIYLSSVKQEGSNVLIQGVAQSNERVSELLRNLARGTEWVSHPELVEIVSSNLALGTHDQRRVYNFTVRYQLRRPQPPKAAPGAPAHVVPQAKPKAG